MYLREKQIQTEGSVSTESLRQECALFVQGTRVARALPRTMMYGPCRLGMKFKFSLSTWEVSRRLRAKN